MHHEEEKKFYESGVFIPISLGATSGAANEPTNVSPGSLVLSMVNGIPQGTGSSARLGDSIQVESIYLSISICGQGSASDIQNSACRVVVVHDREGATNQSQMDKTVWGSLFTTLPNKSICAARYSPMYDRFKILYDRVHTMVGLSGGAATGYVGPALNVQARIPIQKKIQYRNASGTPANTVPSAQPSGNRAFNGQAGTLYDGDASDFGGQTTTVGRQVIKDDYFVGVFSLSGTCCYIQNVSFKTVFTDA